MGANDLGIQTGQARHPYMAVESSRLASFDTWPRRSPVTPEDLAHAGFYHEGEEDKGKLFLATNISVLVIYYLHNNREARGLFSQVVLRVCKD